MPVEILLPSEIEHRLLRELKRAGSRETGGILMGECLAPGRFRVADMTIERVSGTLTSFFRTLRNALEALTGFFNSTHNQYTRFNYLGEWHSHPSFVPRPSSRDIESVQSIAEDPEVGANFVALLVVKLGASDALDVSATIFQATREPVEAVILREDNHARHD